jgi:hypothetical protein
MVRDEPALHGEQEAGEQCEAGQRRNGADCTAEHRHWDCHDGEPERARKDRVRLAKERGLRS